ncbi:DUF2194 domain-containing protein [Paenibacillus oenotherae]|uniref:DUF2194 domain-containing protein n=1 Tax=Paenibacillus oenotherae TaxID=1435645 RepID=A0ABS7D5B9_9BACL|nr:DUF2194 domain-containing protein [Paenibacillus oenotherae]MBW7474747.1 DUF2194 domain-containing protein [Paenibacillus oenotherae]
MKEQFKLSRQIYLILGFVLVLALVIQTSRMDSLLKIGGKLNGWQSISAANAVNPLSEQDVASLNEEKILLLYDAAEKYSVRIKGHTEQLLSYMKKKRDLVDVKDYQGAGEGYDSIIITFSNLEKLSDNEWLEKFVEEGGRILFAATPVVGSTFYRIYRKLGIDEVGDYAISKGLVTKTNILVNYKNEEFSEKIIENTSLQIHISAATRLHAESKERIPLLWDIPYGKGLFVVFNGTMLQEKTSRGFLTGAISLLKEDNLYPVINSKLVYIDDFPAPFPIGYQEDIFQIYKRSMIRFFKEVWWPDMVRLETKYDLKYTGVVIQSYDNNTKAPFDAVSDNTNLITYGREVLKRGGEIGIHGYNHQSLTFDPRAHEAFGYSKWDSVSSMEESIRTVVSLVDSTLPMNELHNYVPPSNVLSKEGREALKAAWPGLKSISSIYSEDANNLGYVQEFEVAPDGIVELPRITSGFLEDEFNEWAMANAATSIGVFSHFIHPDDILDRERSFPYTWEQLYGMLKKFMDIVHNKYGWLRSTTATEAGIELERYSMSQPHFDYKPDRIEGYVNQYAGGKLYYYLRSDKKITREDNCTVTRIDDETYLVEVEDEHFTIGLEG